MRDLFWQTWRIGRGPRRMACNLRQGAGNIRTTTRQGSTNNAATFEHHILMWQWQSVCADINSATNHPQQQRGRDPHVQHVAVFAPRSSDWVATCADTRKRVEQCHRRTGGQLRERERYASLNEPLLMYPDGSTWTQVSTKLFQLPKFDWGCWNLPKCFQLYPNLNEALVYYPYWIKLFKVTQSWMKLFHLTKIWMELLPFNQSWFSLLELRQFFWFMKIFLISPRFEWSCFNFLKFDWGC